MLAAMSTKFVLSIVVVSSLAGCATMLRGTEQAIFINTQPVGADVQLSNGASCIGPCQQVVRRDEPLTISVSKEGCSTQTATMVPTLSGGGVLTGGLIDYGTGAVYDLQPNPLTITLSCVSG